MGYFWGVGSFFLKIMKDFVWGGMVVGVGVFILVRGVRYGRVLWY